MKKNIFIFLFILGIVLTGCSQKDGISENELFTKRQECNSLFNTINDRINEYNDTNELNLKITLEEIFFSPILNKCIYIDTFEIPKISKIWRLMDIGNNPGSNPIDDISCEYLTYDLEGKQIWNDCDSFNNKIKELKGEK